MRRGGLLGRSPPLAASLLLCGPLLLLTHAGHAAPGVGEPAPTFSLRDREGTLLALDELAYAGAPRPRRTSAGHGQALQVPRFSLAS